jgi:sugar phosphate isomerase/epimerase
LTAAGLERLSLHEFVRMDLPVDRFLGACAAGGIGRVALLRRNVVEHGVAATRRLLDDLGLALTSYSSVGGWASGVDPDGAPMSLAENVGRLDEVAELGATLVVAAAGPLVGGKDLDSARGRVGEGLAELAPHAAERGLKIALEPLHPIFCPDRSVVTSLRLALDLVEPCPSESVGIALDSYHVWWDPDLAGQVRRAGARIFAVHVNDFILPLPPDRRRRGLMGEGCIDLHGFRRRLEDIRYAGPYEVEVISEELSALPMEQLVARVIASYRGFLA